MTEPESTTCETADHVYRRRPSHGPGPVHLDQLTVDEWQNLITRGYIPWRYNFRAIASL